MTVATQTVKANDTVQYVPRDGRNNMFHCNIFCHPISIVKQIRNLNWGISWTMIVNKKIVMSGLPQQWRDIG